MNDDNQISCQSDNDCPPSSTDTQEFFCQGTCYIRNVEFCFTAAGKEDAVCRYVEDCKRACKTNKEGSFCKGCQDQAAEDRTKPYRERIIDCCRGDLDDICIGRQGVTTICIFFATTKVSFKNIYFKYTFFCGQLAEIVARNAEF